MVGSICPAVGISKVALLADVNIQFQFEQNLLKILKPALPFVFLCLPCHQHPWEAGPSSGVAQWAPSIAGTIASMYLKKQDVVEERLSYQEGSALHKSGNLGQYLTSFISVSFLLEIETYYFA